MNFNLWFKTKSRQWVLAGDIDAAAKRAIKRTGDERRINLLECEASLDSMHLRFGAPQSGRMGRIRHLITGASARFALRAAPDIRLDAGASAHSQRRDGSDTIARGVPTTIDAGPMSKTETAGDS